MPPEGLIGETNDLNFKIKKMKQYTIIFLLLLVTEIAIAIFHFHKFVRGFVGDILVIPLLFTLLKAVTKLSTKAALLIVLLLAFCIEILQYFKITEILNIKNQAFTTIIGTSFDWWDLLAYCFGILPVLLTEKFIKK